MLNTCPKCGVLWTEVKPPPLTECPTCGVIFVKFLAAQQDKRKRAGEQAAQAARAAEKAAAKTKPEPLVEPKAKPVATTLARCPACDGLVAIGTAVHAGRTDAMTRRSDGMSAWPPGAASALMRTWRPWERSTSPRTAGGKARTSRNGFKGGHRERPWHSPVRSPQSADTRQCVGRLRRLQ